MANGKPLQLPTALDQALARLSIADAARARRPKTLTLGESSQASALELEALAWVGELERERA